MAGSRPVLAAEEANFATAAVTFFGSGADRAHAPHLVQNPSMSLRDRSARRDTPVLTRGLFSAAARAHAPVFFPEGRRKQIKARSELRAAGRSTGGGPRLHAYDTPRFLSRKNRSEFRPVRLGRLARVRL